MEMKNSFEMNGVKISCEMNEKDGHNVAFERVKIEFELYAETKIEGDEIDWMTKLWNEIDRQAKEKGFDLDIYNPIFNQITEGGK